MRVVAIAAGDACREHLALLERAVIVHLVLHLPVGEIELARERRDDMGVGQPAPRHPVLGELAAARVTQSAGLDLLAQQCRRKAALRVAGRCVVPPPDILTLIEAHQQAALGILLLAEWPPALLRARPCDVARALAMAGLASDAD